MNQAAWERLVDMIDVKYGLSDHGRSQTNLEDQPELKQQIDYVCFERDGETYRLERVTRPAIKEKKSIYHRAAGSSVRFENVYDTNEVTHKVQLLRQVGGEWQAIDLEDLAL